jgi:hypothetical protein
VWVRRSEGAEVHWQDRLCALERLDMRLLVDGEDDRIGRRIHVQPATSRTFSTSCASGDILNEHVRRGLSRAPDASDQRMTDGPAPPSCVYSNAWLRRVVYTVRNDRLDIGIRGGARRRRRAARRTGPPFDEQ